MRIALLSDIHGNWHALKAVLADLSTAGEMDYIWCLGDLAAFGGRPAECIRRVRELEEQYGKDKCKVLGGNTDRYLVTGERFPQRPAKDAEAFARLARDWTTRDAILNWNLQQLLWDDYQYLASIIGKETWVYADNYGGIIGYHAIPGDDEAMNLRPDSPDEEARDALLDRQGRMGIGGHTHLPMDRDLGRWRAINPGSVGLSFTQKGKAEWGIVTIDRGEAHVELRAIPYDVEAAIADLAASDYPYVEWAATRLRP